MNSSKQLYSDNGIYLSKPKLYAGEQEGLLYKGLLAESGADKIYAYIGYGEDWTEEEYVEMENSQDGFKANFIAKVPGVLNICFKDSANNWDNNSGRNYTYDVLNRKTSAKVAKETKEPKVKETKTKRINAKEAKEDTKAGRGKTGRTKLVKKNKKTQE